ncbi:hypothetical protein [Caenimonas koreensis]|uniref:Uncharacterized protein n=1 Tax=Caenimonas koreensis DSM 17982 TaxID=1121255 RepID=A0A844AXJ2_9BURK|nr:hypothetical protein [Caenimonas koreensis]MRD49260.1 hypothetical protein [Caenimonas koreensis DSM 17982]
MIELANAPTDGRTSQRPLQDDGKATGFFDAHRTRGGHAWPFLSSYAAKSAANDAAPKSPCSSGS